VPSGPEVIRRRIFERGGYIAVEVAVEIVVVVAAEVDLMGTPSFAASAKGGGLDPRQHNIALRRRTRSPPREARRPHHALSRSVPKRNRAQPILECGGSAAAFPKPPAPRSTQREAPPRFSHHPKTAVILRSVFRDEESHPCRVPHPSPPLRRVGVLIQRHHRISFLTKMHRPPREARRPPRALSRSVRTPRSAQTTMECGGSAAAFPKDARATIEPCAKRPHTPRHIVS
jgi:hypothetical protein